MKSVILFFESPCKLIQQNIYKKALFKPLGGMTMRSLYTLLVGILLLLTACQTTVVDDTPIVQEPITIGWYGPLTGELGAYGTENKNAVELAVSEINAADGIGGRQLVVIYEDSACGAKEAVNAANKLTGPDNVKVVLGGFCSTEMLAAAPVFNERKVVNIGLGTSPDISKAGDYIFRNTPSDEMGAVLLAQKMYADGKRNLAVLSSNADYPQAFRKKIIAEFEKAGGKVVADQIVDPESVDHRTAILKIKQANPDSIFIVDKGPAQMARMAKQIREADLDQQMYVPLAFTDPESREAAGEGAEGAIIVDSPSLDTSNAKAKAFMDSYVEVYGKEPGLAFYTAASFDSVFMLRDAMLACGGDDPECIKQQLYNLKSFTGTLGTYSVNADGDVEGIPFVFRTVKNGELTTLES
jgi:branched-chain amino acid transport system substrate-binding protein